MASSTAVLSPPQPHPFSEAPPSSCPSCGHNINLDPTLFAADDAYRRIRDLEAQVKLLNSKAAAAVDKLADYEDENRFLRAANARRQQHAGPPQDDQTTPQTTRLASLGNLLRRRNISGDAAIPQQQQQQQSPPPNTVLFSQDQMPVPIVPPIRPGATPAGGGAQNNSTPILPTVHHFQSTSDPHSSPSLTLTSLHAALDTERQLRQRAETSLTQTQTDLVQTQSELEELTAQLFGQANEMVATERRERAKLEERVKMLERREREKKGRLDRLEERVKRVERVRTLVG